MGITFLRSTMTGLLNKLLTSLKNRRDLEQVKSFKESQKNEEAFDTVDRGICSVPVNQIVGSVGRYHDFYGKFRLKEHVPSDKLQNIRKAMREGKKSCSDFSYSAPLAEVIVLGTLAVRTGKALDWDAKTQTITNNDAAKAMFKIPARKGWRPEYLV